MAAESDTSKDITGAGLLCPLCGGNSATALERTGFATVWDALAREHRVSFADATKNTHTPADYTELFLCDSCGLQFFSPAVPGDSEFYRQLTCSSPTYYNTKKWEFDFATSLLRATDTVLDVGCGAGAFVYSAAKTASLAVGADTNAPVTTAPPSENCRLLTCSVDELASMFPNHFSFVTAFQVLEHIAPIMPFAKSAFNCVRPGGVLVVSVPNRDRRREPGFEVLDHPPHHMSRWSVAQFSILAHQLGGSLRAVVKEPLNKSQTVSALRTGELEVLMPRWVPARSVLVKACSRIALMPPLSLAWRALRLPERFSMWGMSMVAIIQKPAGAGLDGTQAGCAV